VHAFFSKERVPVGAFAIQITSNNKSHKSDYILRQEGVNTN